MPDDTFPRRSIEPEYLGPLTDRPLAGGASARPDDIFPGASAFLSRRHQVRREAQWNAARPLAERLLRPDEHILYVAHAMQVPPLLHSMALGIMALTYHQVVLVFTESRLIEVLLSVRGKRAESRVRSFPLASVSSLKLRLGKLVLMPASGRKHAWRVPLKGDRRLLTLLLARVAPRLMPGGAAMAEKLPLWHCPGCGGALPASPAGCDACRTVFRSTRMASWLSLAFPGAGLLYAGHPWLAAADFLGEALLYLVFLMLMLEAGPGSLAVTLGLGAFLFAITKMESIHLSRILVARTKPEPEPSRARFRRLAGFGGLASLAMIALTFPLMGSTRQMVERDLDLEGPAGMWAGSRDVGEWIAFEDDDTARSQWTHSGGDVITLFAYPLRNLGELAEFRSSLRIAIMEQGVNIVEEDDNVPSPYTGFRLVGRSETPEGDPLFMVHYFVVDPQNRDIHHALASAVGESAAETDGVVRDFLSHTRWIEASPPTGAPMTAGVGPT